MLDYLNRLVRLFESISEWSGRILCSSLLIVMLFLVYEIISRYFFSSPTIWAHEFCQLSFAIYSIGLGAYALLHDSHVKMDLLYGRFSARSKAIIDVVTSPILYFWTVLLFIYGGKFAIQSMKIWEHSTTIWRPPIWPMKLMIPLAALLIIFQITANLIRNIQIIINRNNDEH